MAKLYLIGREIGALDAEGSRQARQQSTRLVAEELDPWLASQRPQLAKTIAAVGAIDYRLRGWRALTRYLDDGDVSIDNNAAENSMRLLILGRRTDCSSARIRLARGRPTSCA